MIRLLQPFSLTFPVKGLKEVKNILQKCDLLYDEPRLLAIPIKKEDNEIAYKAYEKNRRCCISFIRDKQNADHGRFYNVSMMMKMLDTIPYPVTIMACCTDLKEEVNRDALH